MENEPKAKIEENLIIEQRDKELNYSVYNNNDENINIDKEIKNKKAKKKNNLKKEQKEEKEQKEQKGQKIEQNNSSKNENNNKINLEEKLKKEEKNNYKKMAKDYIEKCFNDTEYTDLIKMSTKNLILYNTPIDPVTYPYPKNGLIKTDSNGIYAIYDQELQKYQLKYVPEKNGDIYASYAKYKELDSSVYNFNKTLYIKKYYDNYNCIYTDLESITNGKVKQIFYKDNDDNLHICDNLYYYELSNFSFISYNKYLYDRWVTAFGLDIVIIILLFPFFIISLLLS